ncbi:serine hydrolase [Streptomyces sp. NPDC057307]|uniref:serine hydrolase n=1 Tax=Streptomyces sp. NPDC057307 TaxID=3346096 RepID=UPI00363610A7
MLSFRRLPTLAVAGLALAVAVPASVLTAAHAADGPARTAPTSAGVDSAMSKALDALPASDGRYTVAVEDLHGRGSAVYGEETGAFDTASVVKVDILAALLLDAQDRGEPLTAQQKKLAAAMIRSSDNDATNALWKAIGGTDGLNAANNRLGLKDTRTDKDGHWGLTRTTAADQMVLLEAVLGDAHSPLTAPSRGYLRSLMSTVEANQRWGISAAADSKRPGAAPALKNGWLPRSETELWDINSIGRVEYGGHTLLVAVLSDGQPSYKKGVDLVERAATTAVKAFVKAE